MKIAIVNGSPRKGNTLTAIQAFSEGAAAKHEVEVIHADGLSIRPCRGCGSCGMMNGCIEKDETNPTIDKLVSADMIVFATPVYWWGMSAQLKLVIDKCYCRGMKLKGKKIGVMICGGSPVDAVQYQLINKQFECMAEMLEWEIFFTRSFYATASDELAKDPTALDELRRMGAML